MAKASLNELMGSGGSKAKERDLGLDDLKEVLGERMPKMEYSPIGRMRLVNALKKRFGDDYEHIPGISNVLSEFDKEIKFAVTMNKMKLIKAKKGN